MAENVISHVLTIKPRSRPPNQLQKEALLEYISSHDILVKGNFTNGVHHADITKLWLEISNKLNSIEGGVTKTWQQWRKTWHDLRAGYIHKCAQLKKNMNGTGGGPPQISKPDENDEKLAALVTNTIIEGDRNVPEPRITFNFETENETECSPVPLDSSNMMQERKDHSYIRERNYKQVPIRARRLTKTKRLQTSLDISTTMLKLAKENTLYKKEKLKILKATLRVKEEKLAIFKNLQ